jgi:hypothetical protein
MRSFRSNLQLPEANIVGINVNARLAQRKHAVETSLPSCALQKHCNSSIQISLWGLVDNRSLTHYSHVSAIEFKRIEEGKPQVFYGVER